MVNENISKAIFGSFDGLTSVLGVLAAGYIAGDIHALILVVVGLAIAECVGMASGSYLSEEINVHSLQHAGIIGIAAFISVLLPAIPFLLVPKSVAVWFSLLFTCLMVAIIAQTRAISLGLVRAYVQTFAIVIVAAGVSIGVSLLLNGGSHG